MAKMELCLLIAAMMVGFCLVSELGYGAPSRDRISALPGQPNVSFAQYSGYITINPATGQQFFYYFVEADKDPESKPLTLWLNGGPGCSSVGDGAFTENGPFRPFQDSCNVTRLRYNPFSWNKASNMLYLDTPAGVGWSYSNTSIDLIRNDDLTANDNFMFLLNWFDAFPKYKGRKFYITGESYAGHYAPQLAALVVDYMSENGTSVINLVGMAIGNPFLYGLKDNTERVFYLWTHGLISDNTYDSLMENCNFSAMAKRTKACKAAFVELEREVTTFISPYDVIIDVCLHSSMSKIEQQQRPNGIFLPYHGDMDICIREKLVEYMNLPKVQDAFHANRTKLPYRWYPCHEGVLTYDSKSVEDMSLLPVVARVLKGGISVLLYSGDADSLVPFSSTRRLVDELAQMVNLSITVPYTAWFDRGQVGGWVQVYGPLSFATVRGASHSVPFSHPERALSVFQTFLSGHTLPLSSAASLQIATA